VSAWIQAAYAAAISLGLRGAWKRGGARRHVACGVALLLSYFWGVSILVLSIARYMVPSIGLALILLPGIAPFQRHAPARR
jgi:hypothetical protein